MSLNLELRCVALDDLRCTAALRRGVVRSQRACPRDSLVAAGPMDLTPEPLARRHGGEVIGQRLVDALFVRPHDGSRRFRDSLAVYTLVRSGLQRCLLCCLRCPAAASLQACCVCVCCVRRAWAALSLLAVTLRRLLSSPSPPFCRIPRWQYDKAVWLSAAEQDALSASAEVHAGFVLHKR